MSMTLSENSHEIAERAQFDKWLGNLMQENIAKAVPSWYGTFITMQMLIKLLFIKKIEILVSRCKSG